MYDLGPTVPDSTRHVEPGSCLLVSGPPETDKRDFALELLAAGQRRADGVLVLGTAMGAVPLTGAYEGVGGTDDERFRVVDATGYGSLGDGGGSRVEVVPGPADLAEIGSAISRAVDTFVTMDTDGLRIGVVSVTALLEVLDTASVYKFLRTLAQRVDRAGFLLVATIDTDECNEQTVGMMADAFDGVFELRASHGGLEVRPVGLADVPRAWTPLSAEP